MKTDKKAKVAIIGAGVSGLKAAHSLLSHPDSKLSASDIIIIEAQDRIGGRIFTDHTSSKLGLSYDLGASWFHDSLSNSTLEYLLSDENANEFNFNRDTYYDDKETLVYSKDHEGPIDTNNLKLRRVIEDLEKFIEIYFFDEINKPDISLKQISAKFFDKYDKFLTQPQKHYCSRMIRHLELWYGITWDLISAKYSIMDHQGRDIFNKKGYDFLIRKLAEPIPSDKIILGDPVRKISRNVKSNYGSILVESRNGLQIYSEYLIVTVPQSILALHESSPQGILWSPPLPASIQDSLKTIHFGALGKVIFEFESIWWDEDTERFNILAEVENEPSSTPLTNLPDPFTFPMFAVNISAINRNSSRKGGSLCILTQSPFTEYIETHPEEAWDYYKPMLKKFAIEGKSFQPPINTITSSWTKNPYIRGSYAALHTNDDPTDLIIQLSGEHSTFSLSGSKIRFAGEHTISDGAGCVHGAYDSGEREANWIIHDMNQN